MATVKVGSAFAALSDPVCRDLLTAIGEGEATVSELVDRLAMSQPQVSKHLGVLKEAGLVRVRPQGRWRFYSVEGRALRQVLEWLERFTAAWNDRLDRLDDVVAGLEEEVP